MRLTRKVIAIHENLKNSLSPLQSKFMSILSKSQYEVWRMNCNRLDFWHQLKEVDYFIYNWDYGHSEFQIANAILPILENEYRIPCFPNQQTRWHYDDKIKQIYLLQANEFPIVDSWIFWDQLAAEEWLTEASYPLVFKLPGGASSANVVLVHNSDEAVRLTRKMFSLKGVESGKIPSTANLSYFRDRLQLWPLRRWIADKRGRLGPKGRNPYWQRYRDVVLFQKFLPSNNFDTRITIIGDRAFCFTRENRPNDFRASGSGKINYDINLIDKEMVKIAFRVSSNFGFQSMAYDFLNDEKDIARIVEISYTFMDHPIYNCPGYYDSSLQWNTGHFWPQYCILQDLLEDQSLVQPEIENEPIK